MYALYMKLPIPIIIAVLFIAIIAFFAFRSSDTEDQVLNVTPTQVVAPSTEQGFVAIAPDMITSSPVASPSATQQTVQISIDDLAFDPATVTIPVGATVVFTNNGQALHWPASDPHPTHTDLSGFDAKKGLATGEKYSYTFATKGTFGMHDHLNAKMKGSIVVQ